MNSKPLLAPFRIVKTRGWDTSIMLSCAEDRLRSSVSSFGCSFALSDIRESRTQLNEITSTLYSTLHTAPCSRPKKLCFLRLPMTFSFANINSISLVKSEYSFSPPSTRSLTSSFLTTASSTSLNLPHHSISTTKRRMPKEKRLTKGMPTTSHYQIQGSNLQQGS